MYLQRFYANAFLLPETVSEVFRANKNNFYAYFHPFLVNFTIRLFITTFDQT